MSNRVRTNYRRERIYGLLISGKCKARVAALLDIPASAVQYHARKLEDENYIKRISGSKNPILYEKGPRGGELDKVIKDLNIQINATGVNSHAKNVKSAPTARVHHGKVKLNVIKAGDIEHISIKENGTSRQIPFLKHYFENNNVQKWKGKIPYNEHWVSVEYEETPNKATFYIYPPPMDLTEEELPEYEHIWIRIAQGVANYLQKHASWRFGIPECTNWKPHFGIDDPALFKNISDQIYVQTPDGTAWTSGSEGRSEKEFSEVEKAMFHLTIDDKVISLQSTVNEIIEGMEQIVRALKLSQEAARYSTEINGLMVKQQAEETLEEVRKRKKDEDQEENAEAELRRDPRDEVMYQ